jgi:hydrogenase small subunit
VSNPITDLDILWITAGLSCDGDTIAITAATLPSVEDILLGIMPGIPRVRLHNPVLAYSNGNDFLDPFRQATAGQLGSFVLVVEGPIPNQGNKAKGVWAGPGIDEKLWRSRLYLT